MGADLTFHAPPSPPSLNPAVGDPAEGTFHAYDPLMVMRSDSTFGPGLALKWGYIGKGNHADERPCARASSPATERRWTPRR